MKVYPAGLAMIAVLGLALALPRVAPSQGRWAGQGPEEQRQWAETTDETFGPGYGMGRQLMTQEEWLEHREKMWTLGPEERERYRQEWHAKMVERAREKGIALPETLGPHRGMGPGYGAGRWGTGGGRGPGGCWR